MQKPQYSQIPESEKADNESAVPSYDYKKISIVSALVIFAVFAFVHSAPHSRPVDVDNNPTPTSLPEVIITRNCTFAECKLTRCDPVLASFVCIEGTGATGCASTAIAWYSNPDCSDYCDLSFCSEAVETPITLCSACTKKECKVALEYCTIDNPYFCSEGSAEYGCSSDSFMWPTSAEQVCGSCCDSSSCK